MKYIKLFEAVSKFNQLIIAIDRGNSGKIKELIKQGVDINSRTSEKPRNTALMCACYNRYLIIQETLLSAGADTNLTNDYGRTALMTSTTMKLIDNLLKYGADVNIQNMDGETALMEYLEQGKSDEDIINTIEKFRKHNLNLDLKNDKGLNFYDKLRYLGSLYDFTKFSKIQDYMDSEFPQYKEEWDFQNDVNKYNL